MKDNTPKDITLALENLLHTVVKYEDAVVVGYVFSANPVWITSVSNVKEEQFNGTLEFVHSIAKAKAAQGLVLKNSVKRAS
jgi:7-keto-8-aminopelargonate synthetase-like enzyme